jgi:hypothetical protein
MATGRIGRGKITVRNRDTDLRLISGYINAVRTTGEDYRNFKTKAKKQIIQGI